MEDRTDFGQVNWSLKDDHAEERKQHLGDVWKHIRPIYDKCPAREMEKVSIGIIPESEEQNARNWYDVCRRLNEIGRRLDPRLSHDNRTPYDPIDLAFRIDQAVHAIDKLKSEISSRFNFVEPAIDHWTDPNV